MNMAYIMMHVLAKSTQKLKSWPKAAAKKTKVEILTTRWVKQ
jgi:hypothetical protein